MKRKSLKRLRTQMHEWADAFWVGCTVYHIGICYTDVDILALMGSESMEKPSYYDFCLLDLYAPDQPRRQSLLYHVLKGKHTVSNLLQVLQYSLQPYFHLFPHLKRVDYEHSIAKLERAGYLKTQGEEGLIQTSQAVEQLRLFHLSHQTPKVSAQFYFANILPLFRSRVLFIVQVLSEYRYRNQHYYLIENSVAEQYWFKRFIRSESQREGFKTLDELALVFYQEWQAQFQKMSVAAADSFILQFEGHHIVRKTSAQIASRLKLLPVESEIKLQQLWLQIMEYTYQESRHFPILFALLQDLIQTKGLAAHSAEMTWKWYRSGLTIAEISQQRHLKPSTVKDHLLEIAIFYPAFIGKGLLTAEQRQFVRDKPSLGYQEIQAAFPSISFFRSRFMQILSLR